ncbi:MAG: zinc ribbon domain-containing protein [Candidatus Aureabacteria bacterium]|nr:zinc ribbon domain-containing protein [Candidatus Auribacterota bacterium]
MPVYSYRCKDCNEPFELLVGVTSEKTEFQCHKCKSTRIEKMISGFSIGGGSDKRNDSEPGCPTGTCPACH